MNHLEDVLHSALHEVRDQGQSRPLSGPALRRKARVHTLRVRTGGIAVAGAAAVTGVVVAPSLISTPSQRLSVGVGDKPSVTASTPATPTPEASGKTAGTDPVGKAQPSASFTAKPVASTAAASTQTKPAPDGTWDPAGALIDDPTVLATAPKVAASDTDWQDWGGQLLDQSTVKVVFAEREPIDADAQYLRPLAVITGRTAPGAPLRVAALTTLASGIDGTRLEGIRLEAMTTVKAGDPEAIAASDGLYLYVVAEAGVDSATYTYRDDTGLHTADMKVADGVATALVPMADLKASAVGEITSIKALSHGKVVWDAAPVAGR